MFILAVPTLPEVSLYPELTKYNSLTAGVKEHGADKVKIAHGFAQISIIIAINRMKNVHATVSTIISPGYSACDNQPKPIMKA